MVSRISLVEKLSEAVFSNLGDPFQEQAFPKSFYYPSPKQKASSNQKQTALDAVTLNYVEPSQKQLQSLDDINPTDRSFLHGSNHLVVEHLDSDNSHFNESWPSTEHSSLHTPESVPAGRMQTIATAAKEVSSGNDRSSSAKSTEESVIGRYIERFRFGQPASREERERCKVTHQGRNEFWWLHSSPPFISTPALESLRGSSVRGKKMDRSPIYFPEQLNVHPSGLQERSFSFTPPRPATELLKTGLSFVEEYSDVSQLEPLDSEAVQLQEKANKLLQQSEMSLSSCAPVSSEGVGSSSLSSNPSVEEAVRKHVPNLIIPSTGEVNISQLSTISLPHYPIRIPHSTIRPEDDILFQWRLRRKMEQARETALPVVSRRKFHSPPSRLPRQGEMSSTAAELCKLTSQQNNAKKLTCVAVDTGYTVASPMMNKPDQKLNLVSPHLHLMCDVLPCPYQKQSQTLNSLPHDVVQAPETTLVRQVHCKPLNDVSPPDHLVLQHDHDVGTTEEVTTESHGNIIKCVGSSESEEVGTTFKSKSQEILALTKLKKGAEEQMPQIPDQNHAAWLEDLRRNEEKGVKSFRPPDLLKESKATHVVSRKSGISDDRTKGLRPLRTSKEQCQLSHHVSIASKERLSKKSKTSHEEQVTDPPQKTRVRERRREAPPLSPIHNVLGQVVSERLFSPPASPRSSRGRPRISAITNEAIPFPDPASSTSTNIPQSLEVIAQLLEQAEDSDGTDFESDPLLSLLRQQRSHIKDQLRDVDLRMGELQKDQAM